MTIDELTTISKSAKVNFSDETDLCSSAYDALVEQLKILAKENSGNLPKEFILSDNNKHFINFESILSIFKYLNLRIDSISNTMPVYAKMNRNIPRTTYTNEFNKLYHIILVAS